MSWTQAALALAATALLAVPQSGARVSSDSPTDFTATYDATTRSVTLTWDAPVRGDSAYTYPVWRDGSTLLGNTTGYTFSDMPSTVPDAGYLYFVSASPPGQTATVSLPAVAGVATLSCEVVTVSTSWSYPYLYAHLHEECLGGTYTFDLSSIWQAPTSQ